jgi:hypothetical protein
MSCVIRLCRQVLWYLHYVCGCEVIDLCSICVLSVPEGNKSVPLLEYLCACKVGAPPEVLMCVLTPCPSWDTQVCFKSVTVQQNCYLEVFWCASLCALGTL